MSRLLELRMARAIWLLTELERMLFIAGCPRKLFISGCPRINNLIGTFPCIIFFIWGRRQIKRRAPFFLILGRPPFHLRAPSFLFEGALFFLGRPLFFSGRQIFFFSGALLFSVLGRPLFRALGRPKKGVKFTVYAPWKLAFIHTDCDTVYLSNNMKQYCRDQGLGHKFSSRYRHDQNHKIERAMGTIGFPFRAMMIQGWHSFRASICQRHAKPCSLHSEERLDTFWSQGRHETTAE